MRRSEDHVPFSWALALICLLHVSDGLLLICVAACFPVVRWPSWCTLFLVVVAVSRRRAGRAHFAFSSRHLTLSVPQVSVWSIGVIESHSRDFFVRETASTKSAYLATNKCQRIQQETFGFHLEQQVRGVAQWANHSTNMPSDLPPGSSRRPERPGSEHTNGCRVFESEDSQQVQKLLLVFRCYLTRVLFAVRCFFFLRQSQASRTKQLKPDFPSLSLFNSSPPSNSF